MSKEKCTLSDEELVEKCQDWIHKLAESGGQAWTLSIPVDFNRDPDTLFGELANRFIEKKPINRYEEILKAIKRGDLPSVTGMHFSESQVDEIQRVLEKLYSGSERFPKVENYINVCIRTRLDLNMGKPTYNSRTWLNSINSDSTGSVVAFDGKVTDLDTGNKYTQRFLEVADCRGKVRLHQTSDDTKEHFIQKLKLLRYEIDEFIKHLES